MGEIKERWVKLLDAFEAWGETGAQTGAPLPTDHELWVQARGVLGELIPAQPDPELLAELRDAFNDGRQPTRIDMDAVVKHVKAAGHHAYVDMTGGNTATIYAGRQARDRHGDMRWSAVAGPGSFELPGWQEPFADTSEFYIGPDDDGTAPAQEGPDHTTPTDIAALIVAVIERVEAKRRSAEQ